MEILDEKQSLGWVEEGTVVARELRRQLFTNQYTEIQVFRYFYNWYGHARIWTKHEPCICYTVLYYVVCVCLCMYVYTNTPSLYIFLCTNIIMQPKIHYYIQIYI